MSSPLDSSASPNLSAPAAPFQDPMHPMNAAEISAALGGIGEDAVRALEQARSLFSIVRPGRGHEREYPAFQSWSSVLKGGGLQEVLKVLRPLGPTDLYGFFAEKSDLLGGITPVEALLGQLVHMRAAEREANVLLASSTSVRLEAVLAAAQALVAVRAW